MGRTFDGFGPDAPRVTASQLLSSTRLPPVASDDAARVAEPDLQALLDALADPDCRRILEATADVALSASEVADTCDLSLSTAYRKLDRLTEGRLVDELVRLHPGGKHVSEFVRLVDDVAIDVDGDGLDCRLTYRRPPIRRGRWRP